MATNDEHRDFTRVSVSIEGTASTGGKFVSGSMVDVSMKGGFLHCADALAAGTACDILMTLHGGVEDIPISVQGRVVRSDPNGMALEFTTIDPESLEYLRNLVRYNAGDEEDADRIDDELKDSLGLKRQDH
jgi:hypothetical protein